MAKLLAGHSGNSLHRLLRVLSAGLLLILLPGLATAFWRALTALPQRPTFALLAGGFLVGLLLGRAVARWLPTLGIAEHEFTHLVAGLPFLCLPTQFVARRSGGLTSHRATPLPYIGPLVEDFVALAPYVLPTFSVATALVLPWLGGWGQALLGLTLGYHLASTWAELLVNWTGQRLQRADQRGDIRSDIAQVGFGFSLVYIPAMALAMHGLVLAMSLNGWAGPSAWLRFVHTGTTGFWLGWMR